MFLSFSIIAFLACTMISCADDMKFPERIEFPAEGGKIKVYSDYNHFKITFRDSNAPIGINDDYKIGRASCRERV